MTPYRFRLPESFRPGEFLRLPRLRNLHDDARYFVSLILTKLAHRDVDERGYVRLMAKYLRKVMNYDNYSGVVDSLLEGGAVTRSPYQVGERAFGYVLADRFREDRHVLTPATDVRLIRRLDAFHRQAEIERRARMLPVHFGLERSQWRLRIDGGMAHEILTTLPPASNPFDIQGILVSDILQRQFRLSVGRYGRVANNITALKRELRAALRVDDDPLHHVDISCCQPALIGQAAKHAGSEAAHIGNAARRTGRQGWGQTGRERTASIYDAGQPTPSKSDLDDYCRLVQRGEFYDFMLSKIKTELCPSFTRDDLKHRFMADVIAKKKANDRGAEYPSEIEDCFRALFPSVYGFIRAVNRDGSEHANLIRELQRLESSLVIETVAADLLTRFAGMFVLTLHDAIFTTPDGIPSVIASFESAFSENGFPMKLKVEEERSAPSPRPAKEASDSCVALARESSSTSRKQAEASHELCT